MRYDLAGLRRLRATLAPGGTVGAEIAVRYLPGRHLRGMLRRWPEGVPIETLIRLAAKARTAGDYER